MLDTGSAPVFDAPKTSRPLHPTMGQGVAERTYLRRVLTPEARERLGETTAVTLNKRDPLFKKWFVALHNSGYSVNVADDAPMMGAEPETRWEEWHEVAHRVALGNVTLLDSYAKSLPISDHRSGADDLRDHVENLAKRTMVSEYALMSRAIANGSLLMSGRHLQQGDEHQPDRNLEIFSNCATASTSFLLFTLLLNGSGVGRDYSDAMMAVDWAAHMPTVVAVIDESHPDFEWGRHMSVRDARHLYKTGKNVLWHDVGDSREGWGKAVETLEVTTYRNQRGDNRIDVLILNFTQVRAKGEPIMGMQGRPSSGPAPLMDAIGKIAKIKGTGLKPWLATLYIDHYLAEPVLVGGARRSARMSTKNWRDPDIFEFIGVKRPIEYEGLTRAEIEAEWGDKNRPLSFLWSSNNSVAVDRDFWERVRGPITSDPLTRHAKMVYEMVMECAYGDGTGEPGFINVDRLTSDLFGFQQEAFARGIYVGSKRYRISGATTALMADLHGRFMEMPYHFITNPCGEIALSLLGGFCVIADVVPFHAESICEAIEVAKIATRALVRVNTMDSVYNVEVNRTNRIGVGVTGIHEAAWKFFGVGFRDVVNPDFKGYQEARDALEAEGKDHGAILPLHKDRRIRAASFWQWMGNMSRAIRRESVEYSAKLGVVAPHTCTTVKPSGSVSKLFGLTEGWHLPAMRHYIRWVQYHKDSPMIAEYRAMGYPVRELKSYRDHFIVGFPTEPTICTLPGIHEHIVTAAEASMEEQFMWLRLGEFFFMEGGSVADWIEHGGDLDSFLAARGERWGNQISYTMKYRADETDYETFKRMIAKHQPGVRCVSVMPETKSASYEYLPEEQVSVVEYQAVLAAIQREDDSPSEDVALEHLDCATGACPISFVDAAKEDL